MSINNSSDYGISEFASAITVYISIISVIYANDQYDSWDILIAILIWFFAIRFRKNILVSNVSTNLTLISLAISLTVLLLSFELLICEFSNSNGLDFIRDFVSSSIGAQLYSFLDFEFLISFLIFIILRLVAFPFTRAANKSTS